MFYACFVHITLTAWHFEEVDSIKKGDYSIHRDGFRFVGIANTQAMGLKILILPELKKMVEARKLNRFLKESYSRELDYETIE